MKEINLKEILIQNLTKGDDSVKIVHLRPIEKLLLLAMKEACNQTIDLCIENIQTKIIYIRRNGIDMERVIINKDSILKTKEQIK